ncbi:MAG: hypothetical protein ACYC60_11385 [Thermoanaerobaculia bacterium]
MNEPTYPATSVEDLEDWSSGTSLAILLSPYESGDVCLVGAKFAGSKAVKPFFPAVCRDDPCAFVEMVRAIGDHITNAGGTAYLKPSPFDSALIEAVVGKTLPTKFEGRRVTYKLQTWTDERIRRHTMVAGDFDIGKAETEGKPNDTMPAAEGIRHFLAQPDIPMPTMLIRTGRGFQTGWMLSEPASPDSKNRIKDIKQDLYKRCPDLCRDKGFFGRVNPFTKMPGTICRKTGNTVTFFGLPGYPQYTLTDFEHFAALHPIFDLGVEAKQIEAAIPKKYTRRRPLSDQARFKGSVAPSRRMLEDLTRLGEHWNWDLRGHSFFFFTALTEAVYRLKYFEVQQDIYVPASLTRKEVRNRTFDALKEYDRKAGLASGKGGPYLGDDVLQQKFMNLLTHERPVNTGDIADGLDVTDALVRKLGLVTLLPKALRDKRNHEKALSKLAKHQAKEADRERRLAILRDPGPLPVDTTEAEAKAIKRLRKELEAEEKFPIKARRPKGSCPAKQVSTKPRTIRTPRVKTQKPTLTIVPSLRVRPYDENLVSIGSRQIRLVSPFQSDVQLRPPTDFQRYTK